MCFLNKKNMLRCSSKNDVQKNDETKTWQPLFVEIFLHWFLVDGLWVYDGLCTGGFCRTFENES